MSDPRTPQSTSDARVPIAAESVGTTEVLDYGAARILLHVSTDMERVHRLNACAKEPWTVRWLESYVQRDQVLYDIGANVGAFSLIGATRGARVLAFEPGFANYARLCKNVVLNGFEAQVIPMPIALDAKTGLAGFKYRSLEPGQSRHRLSRDPWAGWGPGHQSRYQQPVCTMRLDDAVATFSLPPPNHIKLDVDGSELRVLDGADRLLQSSSLLSVLVEIDGENWDQVVERLQRVGFAILDRMQRTTKGPAYALFARERPSGTVG